ncbi:putative transcription regulator Others family [Medicago truncatula]|uniref:Putative transcription regulator Others family n=1 Tax=Medicago truncatula TaxID=3880 RepID=A0A396IKI9_MEDTR|nr:putative transcription regulator Others family [Medicago truncatula]
MKKRTRGDALALFAAVKQKSMEKYESFAQIVLDFKGENIDTRVVKLRVYELFKGHEDLILRFNTFVTTEYEIKLPSDHDNDESRRLEIKDALSFLKKVKDTFLGKNRKKYAEFLKLMKDFKACRIDTSGVAERVKDLFKGHTDLILGFNNFLPKTYGNTLRPQLDTG